MFAINGTLLALVLCSGLTFSHDALDLHDVRVYRRVPTYKGLQKRGWVDGVLQKLGEVLTGARLVELSESKRVYQKTGGMSQALEDFYFFDPIYVRRNRDKMYGLVGEYELRLMLKHSKSDDKTAPEALMIFTRKQNGYKQKEQSPSKTIEYMSGGSQ